MGDNGPMDAFVSFLQTPWAVVVGLVLAVLVGLVIRLVVSSRQRPSEDVSVPAQPQVPATGESPTPTQADGESPERPRAGPEASEESAAPAEAEITADLGLEATDSLMEALKRRVAVESTTDEARIREILREELLALVGPDMDRSLDLTRPEADGTSKPAVVLMVGVNGTGKTTTVGKLARILVAEDKSVLLGAADTFRAAAADQLATWGERVGVDVVRSDREGADPASVAFETVREGIARDVDVVLVDTAGRLQNKSTLMDELGKIKRVMEKQAPVSEVLLVLDATTGQNGMKQAEVFAQATGVTGIVLTKLDGSAKGGIVVSVQRALGVPVKFVGLGEGADDLAPFDPQGFVDAIVGRA